MKNIPNGQIFTTIMEDGERTYVYFKGELLLFEETIDVKLTKNNLNRILRWFDNCKCDEKEDFELVEKLVDYKIKI